MAGEERKLVPIRPSTEAAGNERGLSRSWPGMKPLLDSKLDIAEFYKHKMIYVPVQCGHRTGRVFIFSHEEHLQADPNLIERYKEGMRVAIDVKKYVESEKSRRDIGPAAAVASLMEDGDYLNFLQLFEKDGKKLNGMEHVLLVEEGGTFHHILMPGEDELVFGNEEQLGLVIYSIHSSAHRELCGTELEEALRDNITAWIMQDNLRNSMFFRQILSKCRVTSFEEGGREYQKCIIYRNLFEELKSGFCGDTEPATSEHSS